MILLRGLHFPTLFTMPGTRIDGLASQPAALQTWAIVFRRIPGPETHAESHVWKSDFDLCHSPSSASS